MIGRPASVALLAAAALACLGDAARAAEVNEDMKLVAYRPSAKPRCTLQTLQDASGKEGPNTPVRVRDPFTIRWGGGSVDVPSRLYPAEPSSHALNPGMCFAVFVEGHMPLVGDVVAPESARLLRTPTLVMRRGPELQLELLARFPGRLEDPLPARWAEVFKPATPHKP